MGCCLSKKSSSSPPISLANGSSKAPDPSKPNVNKPMKPLITLPEIPAMEEAKPIKSEKVHQDGEVEANATTKEVLVIKHRRSHERSKKTDSEESPGSVVVEKSNDSNTNSVVRTSSCTKEEVDAILIQCGKLSRSNSAAKTRRYSGSKRSFDFDQNERTRGGGDEEEENGGEEDAERRTHRHRQRGADRVNGSPRERRRRTPSREREDSKSYRSGSRERGNAAGGGGGSRRVSRSPGKRSEINPNPNPNSCGSSVNSSNSRPGKFVSVPATDKGNIGEPSIKRITVKRNIGDACRTAASPRSKSPARAAPCNVQPPPSLSRSNSRKAEQSPYRRNPLGEIDQNSTKVGSGNTNCSKKTINKENESGNLLVQKPNPRTIRAASPSRAAIVEPTKPQVVISRSRSLRKSRDFDFSSETLLSNEDSNTNNNYTALLLKDIQNFHGKSMNNVDDPSASFNLLPSCVTKACSIVDAVADLNSTTTNTDSNQFRFTSTAKKADLMEPSFEKYVTVKRGGGGSLEEQESCGSNNLT